MALVMRELLAALGALGCCRLSAAEELPPPPPDDEYGNKSPCAGIWPVSRPCMIAEVCSASGSLKAFSDGRRRTPEPGELPIIGVRGLAPPLAPPLPTAVLQRCGLRPALLPLLPTRVRPGELSGVALAEAKAEEVGELNGDPKAEVELDEPGEGDEHELGTRTWIADAPLSLT